MAGERKAIFYRPAPFEPVEPVLRPPNHRPAKIPSPTAIENESVGEFPQVEPFQSRIISPSMPSSQLAIHTLFVSGRYPNPGSRRLNLPVLYFSRGRLCDLRGAVSSSSRPCRTRARSNFYRASPRCRFTGSARFPETNRRVRRINRSEVRSSMTPRARRASFASDCLLCRLRRGRYICAAPRGCAIHGR